VSKTLIRKKILKIRRLKKNKKNIKFNMIYSLIKKVNNLRKKVVGGYYPVNFEIDDLEILKKLEKKKIKVSLPVIKKNFAMNFIKWSFKDPLNVNRYGIPEPSKGNNVYPDILLVPIVAFDNKKNRLGYGAGYYDRLINLKKKKKNILTIGLAYDFQEVKKIPISKYDQKLDYVVTNNSILK